jgi:CheY-like chemotaxis protein
MPKRILIADDDEALRAVIRRFLESHTTCEVCGEAVNGVDAIEKAEMLNPDLILLDYAMPGMNGIETGAVLKAMMPELPVILFTGDDSFAIQIRCDVRRHTGSRVQASDRPSRRTCRQLARLNFLLRCQSAPSASNSAQIAACPDECATLNRHAKPKRV